MKEAIFEIAWPPFIQQQAQANSSIIAKYLIAIIFGILLVSCLRLPCGVCIFLQGLRGLSRVMQTLEYLPW